VCVDTCLKPIYNFKAGSNEDDPDVKVGKIVVEAVKNAHVHAKEAKAIAKASKAERKAARKEKFGY
jgi:hypothetical protein